MQDILKYQPSNMKVNPLTAFMSNLKMMCWVSFQFSKDEEEFRFIPSEEKLYILSRIAALDKEKLERERRKDY